MKNNWQSAFVTHFVGDSGRIVQTAPIGKVSWGSGYNANQSAYAQVELVRTGDFKKNYDAYVGLLRELAEKAGVPVRLDAGNGVVTHDWVTKNLGGTDHSDPYGFLASKGISKAQFTKDIKNGLNETSVTPPVTPVKTYAVKAGDTLSAISRAYNTNVPQLKDWNALKTDVIYIKQKLSVDGKTTVTPPAVKPPVTQPSEPQRVAENGTFTAKTAVAIKHSPTVKATQQAVLTKGESVVYDSYVKSDGYVWASYIRYNGNRGYVCVRNASTGEAFGSFK